MFYIYILQSVNFQTYYVGSTKNIGERLLKHNAGKVRSTKNKKPWGVIYHESFATLSEAKIRELYLKSLKSRRAIEKVIKHQ